MNATLFIPVNKFGDIVELRSGYDIGVHQTCNGFVDIINTSGTYAHLVCRRCFMRIRVIRMDNMTWDDVACMGLGKI